MPRFLPLLALAALVSGCVTAEERRAADEADCRDYGFAEGTDAFANCLLELELDRRAAARANRAALDTLHHPIVIYRPVHVPRRR